MSTAPDLEKRMQNLHASGTSVVVDLTDTTFIDCSVIAWLLYWSQRAVESATLHVAIAVAEGSFAMRVIDLVGIRRQIPCHTTIAGALRAVRAEPGG